jgi:hypothetical protein
MNFSSEFVGIVARLMTSSGRFIDPESARNKPALRL